MWQSLERTGCLKNFFLWSNSQPSDDDFSGSLTGFEPTVWTEVTEVLKHSETLLKHSWNSLSFSLETLKWALQVQVCPSVLLSDVGRHLHVAANKHQLLHSCFHFSWVLACSAFEFHLKQPSAAQGHEKQWRPLLQAEYYISTSSCILFRWQCRNRWHPTALDSM